MIYEIKRGNTILASVHAEGSQIVDVMQQDRANMAFVLPTPVDFKRGDKVDVYGQTYQLNRSDNRAKTNNTLGCKYDLEFEAQYYDLAKWQLKGLDKNNQLTLSEVYVTGTAAVIVDLLVRNANRVDAGWTIGVVDDTETEHYTYVNQSLLAVLVDLATRHDTEYWVDNKTIHLQKREQSTGLTLSWGMDNGLYELFRGRTDKSVINRLYVEGGTRNLPVGYGFPRLQLPEASRPYLEVPIPENEQVIEHTIFFDNIFPNRTGSVTAVGENELIIIDDTLDFDINDCKVDGLEFKVAFTSGQLAFVDSFVIDKYDHVTKAITLTRIDDDKAYPDGVPSELLRPAVGDKYVLLDLNLPPSYVTDNQNKLLAAGSAYLDDNKDDKHEYTANLTPIWVKETNPNIRLGYTVRILEPDLNIDKELRIAGYVRDLQEPALYTDFKLGEKLKPSEIMRQYAQQERILYAIQTSGLLDPEQMRKSLFLNRLSERDGYLMLGSNKIKSGFSDFTKNSELWNDLKQPDYIDQPVRKTDAVKFSSVEADTLNSKVYVSGFTGTGYKINPDGSAEFDSLSVRKDLNVNVLNIREITGSGGSIAVTNVAKISEVVENADHWLCSINTDDNTIAIQFRARDIVRCQVWDGKGLKYYTAIVRSVSSGSFILNKAGKTGGGIPSAGDTLFQFGNEVDTARQGLIYLTNSDTGAPYIDVLDGINSDSLAGKTKVRLGKLDGLIDPDFPGMGGNGLFGENVYLKNGVFKGSVTVTGGNAATQAYSETQAALAKLQAIAEAEAKVNAIEIGGVNLLNNSKAEGTNPAFYGNYYVIYDSGEIPLALGVYVLQMEMKIDPSMEAQGVRLYFYGEVRNGLEYEEFYTETISDYSGNYKRYFTTLSVTHAGNVQVYALLGNPNDIYVPAQVGFVRFVQLEEGNKGTPWKLSPFDLGADMQAKADQAKTDAENAAKNYADIQDSLKKLEIEAYADGIVSEEEQRAIQDAEDKLAEAKFHAQAKANEAEQAAKDAAALDATNKINEIEVGGRNLAYNTKNERSNPSFYNNYITIYDSGEIPLALGSYILQGEMKIDPTMQDSGVRLYFYVECRNGLGYEEYYTETISDYSGNYKRYIAKVTVTHPGNGQVYVVVMNDRYINVPSGVASIRYVQLEKSNKPTDWSPAPEDYGQMAFEDRVELAKLGETIIDRGYIKTDLINADEIIVNKLSVGGAVKTPDQFQAEIENTIGYDVDLSPASVALAADSIGNVLDVSQARTTIRVFKGKIEYTPVDTEAQLAPGKFFVYPPSMGIGGFPAKFWNNTVGFSQINFPDGHLPIQIKIGTSDTVSVKFYFTVVKQGTNGAPGAKGDPGPQGPKGDPGIKAPFLKNRKRFEFAATYKGTPEHIEVVRFDNGITDSWYMTKETAGAFSGIYPTDDAGSLYWKAFDVSAGSMATGILFTEMAYIDNLGVNNLRTNEPGRKRIELTADGNDLKMFVNTGTTNNSNQDKIVIEMDDDSTPFQTKTYYFQIRNTAVGYLSIPSAVFTSQREQDWSQYNAVSIDSRTGQQADFTKGFPLGYMYEAIRVNPGVEPKIFNYYFKEVSHGLRFAGETVANDSYIGEWGAELNNIINKGSYTNHPGVVGYYDPYVLKSHHRVFVDPWDTPSVIYVPDVPSTNLPDIRSVFNDIWYGREIEIINKSGTVMTVRTRNSQSTAFILRNAPVSSGGMPSFAASVSIAAYKSVKLQALPLLTQLIGWGVSDTATLLRWHVISD